MCNEARDCLKDIQEMVRSAVFEEVARVLKPFPGHAHIDSIPHQKCMPIRIWRFHHAPQEFQALSLHGGDEDWLAFVPEHYASEYIGWLQSGTSFGCREVSEHPVAGGTVYIGAHA